MNEVVKVDPKEFGIEETKALELTLGLNPTLEERSVLIERFNAVKDLEVTVENISVFRELRIDFQKNRTQGIEKWHKITKEVPLRMSQLIDAVKRNESATNQNHESFLETKEKHFDNIEKERLANLQIERVDLIKLYVENAEQMKLSEMEDDVFEAFLYTKKKQYEDRLEAEKLAEQQRIEAEKKAEAERVAEAKRLADEAEKNRIENERLKAEAEAREKAMELERQEAAKKLVEQQRLAKIESDRIEAERKKEAEAREKLEAELKAKKDAELKAEQDRIAEEKRIQAEQLKAAKAPVKQKMSVWVNSFELPIVDVDNDTSKAINEKFEAFKKWSLSQIELL